MSSLRCVMSPFGVPPQEDAERREHECDGEVQELGVSPALHIGTDLHCESEPRGDDDEEVSPAAPKAGQTVTFTLRAVDPDSHFVLDGIWCDNSGYSFGDNSPGHACAVSCAAVNEYGPWDPPPPQPGDLTFTMQHTYNTAGTFHAQFGVTAEACGPRTSTASATATVTITGTTPTS